MAADSVLSVRFGTSWSAHVPGLLDHQVEHQTLVVLLNYSALVAARKAVSVTTAVWRLDGREYRTTASEVMPGEGILCVYAREVRGG